MSRELGYLKEIVCVIGKVHSENKLKLRERQASDAIHIGYFEAPVAF